MSSSRYPEFKHVWPKALLSRYFAPLVHLRDQDIVVAGEPWLYGPFPGIDHSISSICTNMDCLSGSKPLIFQVFVSNLEALNHSGIPAMTKDGGSKLKRRECRKALLASKCDMPFPREKVNTTTRDPRQRKLSDILAGLNSIRAPMVSGLKTQSRILLFGCCLVVVVVVVTVVVVVVVVGCCWLLLLLLFG